MTHNELFTICSLLNIDDQLAQAAVAVMIDGRPQSDTARRGRIPTDLLQCTIDRILDAELRIRGAFVCHTPGCWEVVVGHNDHHRAPGAVTLETADEVRLVCARVCVMVPVRVTQLPESPQGYYRGIVLEMERSSMRYRRGDGVMFSDDQVILPAGIRRPRKPIPV